MSVLSGILSIQAAFQVLASLQLTSYLFPLPAHVEDGATFDYIIVGAGSAGSVIANRLTEDSKTSVLLLDGGDDPPFHSNIPSTMLYLKGGSAAWDLSPEFAVPYPTQRPSENLSQGKCLGGTSSTSFLFYSEGNRRDYDNWAKIVNDKTWSWKHVLPYLKKSQRLKDPLVQGSGDRKYYGNDGNIGLSIYRSKNTQALNKAFEEVGTKYVPSLNGEVTTGCSDSMLTIDDKLRQSSAVSYIAPIKDRPNLFILKNTTVTKILFDDHNNAIGVKAHTNNHMFMTYQAKREVIISAGVFNSAKLLLLSGIGPKKDLHSHKITTISDLPVGCNLQTSTGTFVVINMTNTVAPYEPWNPYKYPASDIEALSSLDKFKDVADYQSTNYINYPKDLIKYCLFSYNFNEELCDTLFKTQTNTLMMYSAIGLKSTIHGKVLLRHHHYKTPPIIRLDNTLTDLEHNAHILKNFVKISETKQFQELGAIIKDPLLKHCKKMQTESIDYWKCYLKSMTFALYNYVGTNAMGSVVDSRLRVKGVKRLRVADASVIPETSMVNIIGPVVMIGEKVSDMIKEDHKY